MARKSKKKGSKSKEPRLDFSKTSSANERECRMDGERCNGDTQNGIVDPALKVTKENVNSKQTSSFAMKMKDQNATCQKQSNFEHDSAQLSILTSELPQTNDLSQSFSSNSNQSLSAGCTKSMTSLSIDDDTPPSCCIATDSADPQHLVLDRPKSTTCMVTCPPTVLGALGLLPPELQEMVFQNMSWESARNLAATNKFYQRFINPDKFGGRSDWARFLRSQEAKPEYNGYKKGKSQFACTGCWRLKLEKRFSMDEIIKISLRKGGRSWRRRRCLSCQIKEGKYNPSDEIVNGVNKTMRLCKYCNEFRSGFHCPQCHLCESCIGDTVGEWCPKCNGLLIPPGTTLLKYFLFGGEENGRASFYHYGNR